MRANTPPKSQWHEQRERESGASAPLEMACPGTHSKVLEKLNSACDGQGSNLRVLDIGAGMGSLSRMLVEAGYLVEACDLYPESFAVDGVDCQFLDLDDFERLPYEDQSMDAVLAIEVLEHIESHRNLFAEVHRVLKPGGLFMFSTPNVLSLKSRLMFLFTGYQYSFPSLNPEVVDPVQQHITPLSLDRYLWRIHQAGMDFVGVSVDKNQSTSKYLMFLAPLIWLVNRKRARQSNSVRLQNSRVPLLGRTLFIQARRREN